MFILGYVALMGKMLDETLKDEYDEKVRKRLLVVDYEKETDDTKDDYL